MIGISGSTGFIGSSLVFFLEQKNKYKIVKIGRDNLNFEKDDTKFFSKFDVIVHLAGVSKGTDVDLLNNVLLTEKILKSISKINCPYIVFASSFAVYESQKKIIKTSTNIDPRNFYGWTKKWCEDLLISANKTKTCGLAILRISNVYGNGVDSNSNSVVNSIVNMVKNRGDVLLTGDGNQMRDFLYIDDLCNAIYLVIERYAKKNKFFMENICTGSGVSLNYIAKKVFVSLKIDPNIKYVGPIDKSCWIGDPEFVFRKLKWKPKINIDSGIRKLI